MTDVGFVPLWPPISTDLGKDSNFTYIGISFGFQHSSVSLCAEYSIPGIRISAFGQGMS